jgi:hypothetical protein
MIRWKIAVVAVAFVLVSDKVVLAVLPFTYAQPQVTSSPYFNLFSNSRANTPYQTLVRPQLETDQRFRDDQLRLEKIDRQQQIDRRLLHQSAPLLTAPRPMRGISQSIRATGHQTRFLDNRRFSDHRQYFPPPQRIR